MADDTQDNRTDDEKQVERYLGIIEAYDKTFHSWKVRCEKLIKIYTEARKVDGGTTRRMSLLWSNIQVLQATIYARPPTPNVSRRFKDADPVGRQAAEIIQRSIIYTFDDDDFDGTMRLVRDDYLLTGRGSPWLRYDADFDELSDEAGAPLNAKGEPLKGEADRGDDPNEAPGEELTDERVCIDYVSWRDFGHNVARTWKEVEQVWRIVYMTREKGDKRFGKAFGDVVLDHKPGDLTEEKARETGATLQAAVYEIWDKAARKVVWIARGSKKVLESSEPHLKLKGFFPCPKPAYGTLHTASLVPVPDYVFYQDQVEEIDDLTARIAALLDQLKVVGIYASSASDASDAIKEMGKPGVEDVMIPVPNWAGLKEGGGIKGMVEWWPVDQVAKVLEACFKARKQLIEDVYQITGISDIMRGDTEAAETAEAQHLKSQWGNIRVKDRQAALAAVARDTARITAEIIADKFQPETLLAMTNIKLPTLAEVEQKAILAQQQQMQAQAAQQAEMAQAQQQPPAPPMGHNGGPPMGGM